MTIFVTPIPNQTPEIRRLKSYIFINLILVGGIMWYTYPSVPNISKQYNWYYITEDFATFAPLFR
jgi:hypothetical protein